MPERKTRILIIGSGAAGYCAAIYAVRAGLKPVIVSGPTPGGQLTIAHDIENFPGFPSGIPGGNLMKNIQEQAENLGVEIIIDIIANVDLAQSPFLCQTESGTTFVADALIIATGASAKFIGFESEKKFIGFGVSTCATCDSFFYKNKDVAVIGGGNKAAMEALHLSKIANSVTIIHRRDKLKAEKIIQQRLFSNPKIRFEWNSLVEEFIGQDNPKSLTALKVRNLKTDTLKELKLDGAFISIGHSPQTDLFRGQLDLDEQGYIITKDKSTQTNIEGVFAAGDVQNPKFQQAIIAAASGAVAAMEAEEFLTKLGE